MSEIKRADWDGGPPDTPALVPAKEQSIPRPDWTDGPPDVPAPAPGKEQSISRPDWSAPADDVPAPVEGRPDWPIEPAEPAEPAEEAPKYLAEPEEVSPDHPPVVELTLTDEHDAGIAHGAVTAVLDAIPAADLAGFEAGFDALPPGAQQAIVGELALSDRAELEAWASDDELEEFATTPEGAELVSAWGDEADDRLGMIQARLSRIEANISPAAIDTMWAWFDSLPSAQAKAVYQVLAR